MTKVRNKLSFDLFKEVSHFASFTTSFVRLFIDNVDYGLYTQVEDANKSYLERHGFDPNGSFYKAVLFEYQRYPDQLLSSLNEKYNSEIFESVLQILGNSDHTKLLAMLDSLNDYSVDISTTLRQYFNVDNVVTWLAVNILSGNLDTTGQNFILYSPNNVNCWYLLPWDYDGAWGFYEQPIRKNNGFLPRWRTSIHNWWPQVLFNRFLRVPSNMEKVKIRLAELAADSLSRPRIKERLMEYIGLVSSNLFLPPDYSFLPVVTTLNMTPTEQFYSDYFRLDTVTDINHANYYSTLGRPAPVFMGTPTMVPGGLKLAWTASFDFDGKPIVYDFQLARSPAFSTADIAYESLNLSTTNVTINQSLAPGTYYYRVIIRDSNDPVNNWQIPFDSIKGVDNKYYHGVDSFSIK